MPARRYRHPRQVAFATTTSVAGSYVWMRSASARSRRFESASTPARLDQAPRAASPHARYRLAVSQRHEVQRALDVLGLGVAAVVGGHGVDPLSGGHACASSWHSQPQTATVPHVVDPSTSVTQQQPVAVVVALPWAHSGGRRITGNGGLMTRPPRTRPRRRPGRPRTPGTSRRDPPAASGRSARTGRTGWPGRSARTRRGRPGRRRGSVVERRRHSSGMSPGSRSAPYRPRIRWIVWPSGLSSTSSGAGVLVIARPLVREGMWKRRPDPGGEVEGDTPGPGASGVARDGAGT